MSVEIVMPRAGLTMVEGTISEWKVAEGAQVNKGDVLMEYENEKNVIECEALESGVIHLVAKEGETVPVGGVIAVMAADQGEYDALVNGGASAAAAPAAAPAAPAAAGAGDPVVSPMPGTILKVNVSAGEAVKKGQVLIILEAMKMENEIVSPRDGTIGSIVTSKGASVNTDELLLTLL